MKQIERDTLITELQKREVSPDAIDEAFRELDKVMQEEKDNKSPRAKKEKMAIAIKGAESLTETPIYFIEVDEYVKHDEVLNIIRSGAKLHNDIVESKPKTRKQKVETIAEAITHVKASIFKDRGVHVKTKEPVIVKEVDNEAI